MVRCMGLRLRVAVNSQYSGSCSACNHVVLGSALEYGRTKKFLVLIVVKKFVCLGKRREIKGDQVHGTEVHRITKNIVKNDDQFKAHLSVIYSSHSLVNIFKIAFKGP